MRINLLLLFCLLALAGQAQYTDGGAWIGMDTKYKIIKDLDLRAEVQARLDQGMTRYNAVIGDFGLRYKIMKGLNTTVTYRIGHRQNGQNLFEIRQRVSIDVNYKYDFGKPEASFRIRYQAGRNGVAASEGIPDLREGFRYKLKVKRKIIKKTRGALSLEFFQSQRTEGFYWSDWRFVASVERKLNKKFDLTIGYLYQEEILANDPLSEHILLVGLTVDID
ncbi:MAG: DUF2490 domain-containing protein [Flavobacteriales bacterium]|nr:DUF2490 domain-containing protein [Flavobacteriales bacterium]